jgi:hypothetical protein
MRTLFATAAAAAVVVWGWGAGPAAAHAQVPVGALVTVIDRGSLNYSFQDSVQKDASYCGGSFLPQAQGQSVRLSYTTTYKHVLIPYLAKPGWRRVYHGGSVAVQSSSWSWQASTWVEDGPSGNCYPNTFSCSGTINPNAGSLFVAVTGDNRLRIGAADFGLNAVTSGSCADATGQVIDPNHSQLLDYVPAGGNSTAHSVLGDYVRPAGVPDTTALDVLGQWHGLMPGKQRLIRAHSVIHGGLSLAARGLALRYAPAPLQGDCSAPDEPGTAANDKCSQTVSLPLQTQIKLERVVMGPRR